VGFHETNLTLQDNNAIEPQNQEGCKRSENFLLFYELGPVEIGQRFRAAPLTGPKILQDHTKTQRKQFPYQITSN